MLEYTKIVLLLLVCFFILFTLLKQKNECLKRDESKFLLSSFFITLFLVLIFEIKPHHFLRHTFSISNLITYFFYFALVSLYFIKNAKIIIRNKYLLIITTFILFGLANAIDLLSDGRLIEFSYSEIIEDIFHILGIVYWLLFFVDFSRRIKIKDL